MPAGIGYPDLPTPQLQRIGFDPLQMRQAPLIRPEQQGPQQGQQRDAIPWWMVGLLAQQGQQQSQFPSAAVSGAPDTSLLGRIFGGGGGGLLTQQEQKSARANALMNAGLAVLGSSGARRFGEFAPSLPQAIAAGIQAGRTSYASAADQAKALRAKERRAGIIGQIQEGGISRDELSSLLLDQIGQGGDPQTVGALTELLKSGFGAPVRGEVKEVDGMLYTVDPTTGQQLGEPIGMRTAEGIQYISPSQAQFARQIRGDLMTDVDRVGLRMVPQAYERVQAAAAAVKNAWKNYEESGTSLATRDKGKLEAASAAWLSLAYAYSKLLDPNSVVREGELRLTLTQGSWLQQLQNFFSRGAGGIPTMSIVDSMLEQAKAQLGAQSQSYSDLWSNAQQQLQDVRIPGQFLRVTDPYANILEREGITPGGEGAQGETTVIRIADIQDPNLRAAAQALLDEDRARGSRPPLDFTKIR